MKVYTLSQIKAYQKYYSKEEVDSKISEAIELINKIATPERYVPKDDDSSEYNIITDWDELQRVIDKLETGKVYE